MIRSVSLDLGGTLLTETESRPAIYAAEARRLGASVTDGQMRDLMRNAHARLPMVWDGWYRYSDPWFERFIFEVFQVELKRSAEQVSLVAERLFARFESASTFHLFPGIDQLLTGLRERGLRVGVLSNWSARLPRVLDAVGLASAFDFVVCSAIDRVEKPDPRAFELAAERAGVAPSECLHAGDRVDLDGAARLVGSTFVLVSHAGASRLHTDKDVEVVSGLGELLTSIENHIR